MLVPGIGVGIDSIPDGVAWSKSRFRKELLKMDSWTNTLFNGAGESGTVPGGSGPGDTGVFGAHMVGTAIGDERRTSRPEEFADLNIG
jgi:hypothetical protein